MIKKLLKGISQFLVAILIVIIALALCELALQLLGGVIKIVAVIIIVALAICLFKKL